MRLHLMRAVMGLALAASAAPAAAGEMGWLRLWAPAEITPVEEGSRAVAWSQHANWGPGEQRRNIVTFALKPAAADGWTDFAVRFKVAAGGDARLELAGPYRKEGGRHVRIEMVYAALRAEGAALVNGDFSERRDGVPVGWTPIAAKPDDAPFCLGNAVVVWQEGLFRQNIAVAKDTVVTLSGKIRNVTPGDRPPAAVAADDAYKDAPDTPVSLAAVANMGFADPVAGDGVGGWSDQGPENDLSGFPVDRTDFGGVRFAVADPAGNHGNSVVTLNLRHPENRLTRVEVNPPEPVDARFLYLLHASCFNKTSGPLGKITVTLADGGVVEHEVRSKRDIDDWWGAGRLENGAVAYRKLNASASVGVYLSRFALGREAVRVRSVKMETVDGAGPVWIIAGLTLALRDQALPVDLRHHTRADAVWRPIDTSAMAVKSGSALDLSGLVEPGPAGKYGRAIITPDHRFAFERRPDTPARFFSYSIHMDHLMGWRESKLQVDSVEETRANIRAFAEKARRQGYSLIRFQSADLYLMGGRAATDARFDPQRWDHFCYLFHCLREAGIYYSLDLMTGTGFIKMKDQWADTIARRYKERMYFDADTRAMWRDGVRALLTTPNPHTDQTFARDPALVFVDLFNEQELGVWAAGEPFAADGLKPLAEAAYRRFLRERYRDDFDALAKRWGGAGAAKDFDGVPLFVQGDLYGSGPKSSDANEFVYGLEAEMLDYYRETLNSFGYDGYATLYDVLNNFRFVSLRRDLPVVTSHTYHNHPSANHRPGSRMSQNSPVSAAMHYYRAIAGLRPWNRPFLITEYNAPFWGRYRHQEGLTFPAYAALQGYDGLAVHSMAVPRLPKRLEDFGVGLDPVGRAGQVIAAFAYGRGDVGKARGRVGVALPEAYLRDPKNMNRALAGEQSRLALLTGFGAVLDGVPGRTPPNPALDLVLKPMQGGETLAESMFAVAVDRSLPKDFAGEVQRLRQAGLLPAENLTDAAAEVYQSDTGELTLWTRENRFTVDTPRLQGVASEGGREIALSAASFRSSIPGAAALIALDGEPIGRAKRLLLVFATDALNTDMNLSEDRTVLYDVGTLPVLLETGTLNVSVANRRPLRCYALDLDGERRGELPLRRNGDRLGLEVDTAKLPAGPALYFEWVDEERR